MVDFISLAIIVSVAALCPIIATLVPNKLVPESVFLLIAGAVLGPNLLGFVQMSEVLSFLSELGLAFLFLLAGMEIEPKSIVGHEGRRAAGTWAVSFVIGLGVVILFPWFEALSLEGLAVAIAMTTTAFGTLVPIMKERGLNGTPVGNSIMAYGTWGELAPVIAIAIILSTRSRLETIVILVIFAGIAVLMALIPAKAKRAGTRLFRFVQSKANTTYQTMMRFTMLILVLLVTISTVFDLDIVLGAFAAGFVMRAIIPEGDESLEMKLEGSAYGFFIPLFFIISGAKVNVLAIGSNPTLLIIFIIALMIVRGLPIFISLTLDKQCTLSAHNRWTVATYCTTALPLIVAVTSIGTTRGFMSADIASVLVAAGAITVFLMPFIASLTYRVVDAMPGEALSEIRENPRDFADIIRQHAQLEKLVTLEMAVDHLKQRQQEIAHEGDSCDINEYKTVTQHHNDLESALERTAAEIAAGDTHLDGKSVHEALEEIRKLRKEEAELRHAGLSKEEIRAHHVAIVRNLALVAIAESRQQREETTRE